jgi:hypothetical protein
MARLSPLKNVIQGLCHAAAGVWKNEANYLWFILSLPFDLGRSLMGCFLYFFGGLFGGLRGGFSRTLGSFSGIFTGCLNVAARPFGVLSGGLRKDARGEAQDQGTSE